MTMRNVEYKCDVCGTTYTCPGYLNGWWRYPDGWLQLETDATGSVLVCSMMCATEHDEHCEQCASEPAHDTTNNRDEE